MNAFAALADPTRRGIVSLLAKEGELPVSRIGEGFDMSLAAISQHLRALKQAGLLRVQKNAQQRIYSINSDGLAEIESWIGEIKMLWTERFSRLDAYLQTLEGEDLENAKKGKRQKRS